MAVKDGSMDTNAFQHYNFIDSWNSKNDNALVAVADTYIIQSQSLPQVQKTSKNKYTSIKEIPKDLEQSTVPNDPTNEAVPCMSCNRKLRFD